MKEVNKQSCPTGISRREFLGMAATGAAALTILPSFTVAGLGHVAPSDKLYIQVTESMSVPETREREPPIWVA